MPRTTNLVITPEEINEIYRSGFPRVKDSKYQTAITTAIQVLREDGPAATQLRRACYKATPSGGPNPLRTLVTIGAHMGIVKLETTLGDIGPRAVPNYFIP